MLKENRTRLPRLSWPPRFWQNGRCAGCESEAASAPIVAEMRTVIGSVELAMDGTGTAIDNGGFALDKFGVLTHSKRFSQFTGGSRARITSTSVNNQSADPDCTVGDQPRAGSRPEQAKEQESFARRCRPNDRGSSGERSSGGFQISLLRQPRRRPLEDFVGRDAGHTASCVRRK